MSTDQRIFKFQSPLHVVFDPFTVSSPLILLLEVKGPNEKERTIIISHPFAV